MEASWTIVLTMPDLDMDIALEFKPPVTPNTMMTVKAAKSETL